MVDVQGTVFFTADDGVHGRELWKSDGTKAGTIMVKDITPRQDDYNGPKTLAAGEGTLFFTTDDSVHGTELWKSDGTRSGTVMVKDIVRGTRSTGINSFDEESFAVVGRTLFFTADDRVHGPELWKSDGTKTGTVMVKDIRPDTLPSEQYAGPSSLTVAAESCSSPRTTTRMGGSCGRRTAPGPGRSWSRTPSRGTQLAEVPGR